MRTSWVASAIVAACATGCPDVKVDPGEVQGTLPGIDGPTVEFDPANSIIPFPNNLVLNPSTGRVNIPAPACESPASMAIRTGVLNQLDGFGTFEVGMQATFTEAVDMTTLAANIVMYQRASGTTMNDPTTAKKIPLKVFPSTTLRFDAASCATPAMINAVTIVPMVPLDQRSTYVVALLNGINTATSKPFIPSFTWALVRQSADPVQFDANGNVTLNNTPLDPTGDANHNGIPDLTELQGLDTLWKAHAQALGFLDKTGAISARSDVLVAWEMTTQTTTDPLDPAVTGSPAAGLSATPLAGTQTIIPTGLTPRQFIDGVLVKIGAAANLAAADATCAQIGCDAVGNVESGALVLSTFQAQNPNPLTGNPAVPGAWNDPKHPTAQGGGPTFPLIFVPAGTMPAGGWPTIVFGHGLGSQKESLFVFAPQLAAAGFASVAIDFVDHGSRAVRTSSAVALGCGPGTCSVTTTQACDGEILSLPACPGTETCTGTVSFATAPQCYASFLSADLGGTRDNMRQTILDLQRLVLALKACTPAAPCGTFAVDPTHLGYAGISLGGILGSTTNAVQPDFKDALLSVPGVGWLDILENTQTLAISCSLVDNLIDAGVLVGAKFNPMAGTGLCTTSAWQQQPGYQQFSGIARWVLDPADGANYMAKLATKKYLIQEVIGDQVVPNVATMDEALLVGQTAMTADMYVGGTTASAAILTGATNSKWVQYPTLPAAGTFPGNTFAHASLLRPANATIDGALGTGRMQVDGITFLKINN